MAQDDDDRAFGYGVAVGFAIAALAVHLALVALGGDWDAMYRDLGHTRPLPMMTRLAISTAWKLGVPAFGGMAVGTLIVRRPAGLAAYLAVAVALGVAAAITWWYPSLPIHELAGSIK
jgi:hypothetical protein